MENLKTIEQLIEGKCIVVATDGIKTRHFNGEYVEKFSAVFFAISSHYEILGYIQ